MANPEVEISVLADMIDSVLPGARRYAPAVGEYGFGIHDDGGLSLVRSAPADAWSMTMTAGILHSVTDIERALWWINSRNSTDVLGCYYASIPGEGPTRCNIVYQTSLFSSIYDPYPETARDYSAQLVHLVTDVASRVPLEALSDLKGEPFGDDGDAMGLLVAASFG